MIFYFLLKHWSRLIAQQCMLFHIKVMIDHLQDMDYLFTWKFYWELLNIKRNIPVTR